VLLAYLSDIRVEKDLTVLFQNLGELGDDGLLHTYVLRTPWQQLWIEWVDIGDLAAHMVECRSHGGGFRGHDRGSTWRL